MDFKKILIINLVLLIMIGKILLYIFNKMSKGLNHIPIDKSKKLKFLNNFFTGSEINISNNNFTISNLQSFYKEYQLNSKMIIDAYYDFIFDNQQNLDKNNNKIIEIILFLNKIKQINTIVKEIKNRKLKIFILIIICIVVVNYVILKVVFIKSNFKQIKEKMKKIIDKLNLLNFNKNTNDLIKPISKTTQSLLEKKNN